MKNKEVVLFQEDEVALGYQYNLPKGYDLSDIEIKSYEYDLEDFENKFTLIGKPKKNSIYYLHPYKTNTYVNDEQDEKYFLNEKMNIYRRVGQLLGAKSIRTSVKTVKSKERNINFNGEVTYKVINGGVNMNLKEDNTLTDALKINDTYEHQEHFDLDKNIDELRKFINDCNLHHETDLVSLIDARDGRKSGTILKTRNVKSEITSEYNKILDIAVKVKSPIFKVSAGFKEAVKKRQEIHLEIEYEF